MGALEFVRSGDGAPSIVLVNGAGAPIEGWFRVYGELERLGAVLAYNRFGIGGSHKTADPQTGQAVVRALRELLSATDVRPPFVLVGHSIGGLYVNLFARLHPTEVAGVVLLDAPHPDDLDALGEMKTPLMRKVEKGLEFILGPPAGNEIPYATTTVRQIAEASSFPQRPVAVVTGGKAPPSWLMPKAAVAVRQANQRKFLSLSRQAWQVVAARSGHTPQLSEPTVVIGAIRDVLEAARQQKCEN